MDMSRFPKLPASLSSNSLQQQPLSPRVRNAQMVKITVPNFVPCVPEFVPYLEINPSHSVVPCRIHQ